MRRGRSIPRVPHSARVYDYFIGGKNHFEADREAARNLLAVLPTGNIGPRENRALLGRVVRYLAAEEGIRQFLDIGTGLPTRQRPRGRPADRPDVADRLRRQRPDRARPCARIADHRTRGRRAYIRGDLREPGEILRTGRRLDFGQPVAILLFGILHFVPDEEKPARIVRTLRRRAPAGQLPRRLPHHAGAQPAGNGRRAEVLPRRGDNRYSLGNLTSSPGFAFSGLDLVPPGVVLVSQWRPDTAAAPDARRGRLLRRRRPQGVTSWMRWAMQGRCRRLRRSRR